MQTNWINGQSVASVSLKELAVINPASEVLIDTIPEGCAADADRAVLAARDAQIGWSCLSPTQRKSQLRLVAQKLDEFKRDIAELLTAENGKPIDEALGEISAAVDLAFSYCELAVHLRSGNQGAMKSELNFQHREPRGVVACIVPWNYPLSTAFGNILPALATGNTVIWKPSEKTPLASRQVVERIFGHLPAGVINLVLGDGAHAGEALVRSRGVDAVAFIGSVRTGRRIGEICGHDLKKMILELGGKDPLIIDDTVDVEKAARMTALATYANAGQICTSIERIYVQDGIFADFSRALVSELKSIRVGEGHEPNVQMGPLVDATQLEKVSAQVDDACRRGARVLCGGGRLNRPGYFYPPTVMTDIPHESLLLREETFGPIAPLLKFASFQQAIEMANESEFGLAAMVFTESSAHAIAALQGLKVGTVKINTMRGRAPGSAAEPVKSSGIGHGSGMDILQELTRQKAVHWRGSIA